MTSLNEAFALPLTKQEHNEQLSSNIDTLRGSYKTYIMNTNPYKRITTKSELLFYQLKGHS